MDGRHLEYCPQMIVHGDCMVHMKAMPDNTYDLAIVDPPYGLKEDGKKNHSRGKLAPPKLYTPKTWDREVHGPEYFQELFRVSKRQIIWGANHFIDNMPKGNASCWIIWDKDNGESHQADCEMAWTSFKTAVRLFKYRWQGMLQGNMKMKQNRIHPTEKPVALYKWILQNYAQPGWRILDTHGGSMSIARACHDLGFDIDIFEIDEEYYRDGVKQLEIHKGALSLFEPGAGFEQRKIF